MGIEIGVLKHPLVNQGVITNRVKAYSLDSGTSTIF